VTVPRARILKVKDVDQAAGPGHGSILHPRNLYGAGIVRHYGYVPLRARGIVAQDQILASYC